MNSTRSLPGHSLVRSLVHSHRSLIRLLRTARFADALRCALSFARSVAHSLTTELMGKRFMFTHWMCRFHAISTHCALLSSVFAHPSLFLSLSLFPLFFRFRNQNTGRKPRRCSWDIACENPNRVGPACCYFNSWVPKMSLPFHFFLSHSIPLKNDKPNLEAEKGQPQ